MKLTPNALNRESNSTKQALRIAGPLATLLFAACMQTEPDSADGTTVVPPEDNGRRAGASSTTNWPPEFATDRQKAAWSFDSTLHIQFLYSPPTFPPTDIPVKNRGKIHIFPGKAIPAFDSVASTSWTFPESESIQVPIERILGVGKNGMDTIAFNVYLELDSLTGWIYGFQFDRISGKIVETPNSPFPGASTVLKGRPYYFQGLVTDVTSLLPDPAGNNPEFSFYIPGTPNFCKAQADSFHLGPIPKNDYPLRVVRTSNIQGTQSGTLVEIWELRVTGFGETSIFTLGDLVLRQQTKGTLTLRE